MVATGLMAGAVAALGQMFAISVADNTSSRTGTFVAVLAEQKMEDLRGLTWIPKGSGLPAGTATATFNNDEENVRKGKRVASTSTLDTWLDGGSSAELNEEVVGLGDYGKTLSVLWADSLPEPEEAEESEESEDENLLPSQRWREHG